MEIDAPYQRPQALTISVIGPRTAPEMLEEFSDTLVHRLNDKGIRVTVVPPAVSADTSLTVVKWDPGSRGLRWLAFGAGKGEIIVEVQGLGVQGTAEGWVNGGWFGGDSNNAAEAAADLIGDTIASGRAQPDAPQSHSPHAMATPR